MANIASVSDAARRIAQNEAVFRQANEEVEAAAVRVAARDEDTFGFFCECSGPNCTKMVQLTLQQYEAIRADSRTFCVKPGHVATEVEDIVDTQPGYWVVRKSDEAGEEADRLDPRGKTLG